MPKGSYQHGSACPPAAAYGGDIDSYWCVAAAAGKIAVPATNWTQFATAVSDDLQLTLTTAQSEPFIVVVHDAPDWARLPLFPYSASSLVPHQLMKLLTDTQSAFANDTHCKNEGNIFYLMSAAQAEEKSKWAERLNQWVIDLQLRCANDVQLKGALAEPVQPVLQVQQVQAMAPESTSAQDREPESKWIKAAVFAVLLALISLLLFGASHLVARYPWLSVLLSLPFTTYACWPERLTSWVEKPFCARWRWPATAHGFCVARSRSTRSRAMVCSRASVRNFSKVASPT